MKVVGFNGSPRRDGNTFVLINHVFRVLERNGIETELVQLFSDEFCQDLLDENRINLHLYR